MNELYIDGSLVDLGKDTKVGLTLQVNNIAEMEDRQGNFSNTFKTPKSQNNRGIYEHAELPQSVTEKPYRKLPAKYVQDGIELVSSGYCEFKSAGDFYEQTIFSGILDFFSQIKGKKLSELDLSAYDHTWDLQTVFDSRTNTEGFIYALIDWSDDTETTPNPYMGIVTRDVDVRMLLPNMFIHTLIQKIFEGTNYSVQGNIISTDKYLNRLFPFQLDKLEYDDDFVNGQLFKAKIKKFGDQTFTLPGAQGAAPIGQNIIIFDDDSSAGFFDNPNTFDTTTGRWTVSTAGKFTFTANTIVSMNFIGAWTYSIVFIRERTGFLDTLIDQLLVPGSGVVSLQTQSYTTVEGTYQVGDRIRVEIGLITASGGTLTVHAGTDFSNSMNNEIVFGGEMFMSSIIGDMLQVDLLKAIANQFGIIFVPDNTKKIIYFKTIGELYDNIPNAVDMTDKLDMKTERKISFREGNYAQKNWLRYKENDNTTLSGLVPTKGRGDGFFRIGDENLEEEKTLFTLPFAASDDVIRLEDLSVARIPKRHIGLMANKTEPRMVMLNRQDITGGDIIYSNFLIPLTTLTSSTSIPLTYFIDDTMNDSLGFDRFLISVEYNEFVNQMLNNYKKVEGNFKLNIKDVHNFDFFIPWYLEQYSNYFYVNKIKDFVKGRLTSVELVKM